LITLRDKIRTDLDDKAAEVETLSSNILVLTKVGELYRALMDRLVNQQVKAIEGVVSEGLKTIFFDQDLSFEAEVVPRANKIAIDFFIRSGGQSPLAIRDSPLESFGGGPCSLASLTLRILTLLRLKKYPILVLDETLAAVSDEYTEQTGQFLRRMAASMGIVVLLVTHKRSYVEHADVAYQGIEGADGDRQQLVLETI
jgi:chromosome segregation ATPase